MSDIKYREVTRQMPRCGMCGGARNRSGGQICAKCYSDSTIRRDYINQGATKELPFETWVAEIVQVAVPRPPIGTGRNHSTWASPELQRRAEAMFRDGNSYNAIAEVLGMTRHAIAGFLKRNRIYRNNNPAAPRWSKPILELIWWTPEVVEDDGRNGGWAWIGDVDDLPWGNMMVAGPDHEPMIAKRYAMPGDLYPWVSNGHQWRWDLFDWWRPATGAELHKRGFLGEIAKNSA